MELVYAWGNLIFFLFLPIISITALYLFCQMCKSYFGMMDMNQKHRPSFKADLSSSMGMVVQSHKKSMTMIQTK